MHLATRTTKEPALQWGPRSWCHWPPWFSQWLPLVPLPGSLLVLHQNCFLLSDRVSSTFILRCFTPSRRCGVCNLLSLMTCWRLKLPLASKQTWKDAFWRLVPGTKRAKEVFAHSACSGNALDMECRTSINRLECIALWWRKIAKGSSLERASSLRQLKGESACKC